MEESSGGLGLASILGIVFIVLKLTGTIHWGWLWVLAPFWIPWAIVGIILLVVGFGLAIGAGSRYKK